MRRTLHAALGYLLLFGPAALVVIAALALIGVPNTLAEMLGYAAAGAIAYTIAFGNVGPG